jgi:hypothetical protein
MEACIVGVVLVMGTRSRQGESHDSDGYAVDVQDGIVKSTLDGSLLRPAAQHLSKWNRAT